MKLIKGSKNMRALSLFLFPVVGLFLAAPNAFAEQTEVVIRVLSKDAKFIGTSTGGALVTLRDVETGKVLAEGLTTGATGSTAKIMTDAQRHGATLSDETSAKFAATLDLDRPRLISATVKGPMNAKEDAVTSSSMQWVIPGKPVTGGDAWVVELRGFLIELTTDLPKSIQLKGAPQKIPLQATITMQCGCPITPGGLWDADKLEIGAIVRKGKKTYPVGRLAYAGKASTFDGEIEISEPGNYTVELYAYAPWNGNTGVRRMSLKAK